MTSLPDSQQVLTVDSDLAAMEVFRLADRQIGGGHLYPALISHLTASVAPRLLTGRDVSFAAAASLTQMAGWMAHDSGRDADAARHFDRAWELAHVGDAVELRADVATAKAHLELHLGRAADAVETARAGRSQLARGRRHLGLEARLSAMEARGLAAQGRRAESARTLHQAAAALSTHDGDTTPWVALFDEAALASETARGLHAAGDLAAAREAADRVLALRQADRPRSRALAQLSLASILLDQQKPNPVEAASLCLRVIEGTATVASARIGRELRSLLRRLDSYRSVREVADCLAYLEAVVAQRRALYELAGGF